MHSRGPRRDRCATDGHHRRCVLDDERQGLARLEFEIEPHGLKRQQQVGEDDRSINTGFSAAVMVTSGQVWMLADFHQGVVLAGIAIFLHVAAGLAQEPYRHAIDRTAQAGADKSAAVKDGFDGWGSLVRFLHTGFDFRAAAVLDRIVEIRGRPRPLDAIRCLSPDCPGAGSPLPHLWDSELGYELDNIGYQPIKTAPVFDGAKLPFI